MKLFIVLLAAIAQISALPIDDSVKDLTDFIKTVPVLKELTDKLTLDQMKDLRNKVNFDSLKQLADTMDAEKAKELAKDLNVEKITGMMKENGISAISEDVKEFMGQIRANKAMGDLATKLPLSPEEMKKLKAQVSIDELKSFAEGVPADKLKELVAKGGKLEDIIKDVKAFDISETAKKVTEKVGETVDKMNEKLDTKEMEQKLKEQLEQITKLTDMLKENELIKQLTEMADLSKLMENAKTMQEGMAGNIQDIVKNAMGIPQGILSGKGDMSERIQEIVKNSMAIPTGIMGGMGQNDLADKLKEKMQMDKLTEQLKSNNMLSGFDLEGMINRGKAREQDMIKNIMNMPQGIMTNTMEIVKNAMGIPQSILTGKGMNDMPGQIQNIVKSSLDMPKGILGGFGQNDMADKIKEQLNVEKLMEQIQLEKMVEQLQVEKIMEQLKLEQAVAKAQEQQKTMMEKIPVVGSMVSGMQDMVPQQVAAIIDPFGLFVNKKTETEKSGSLIGKMNPFSWGKK